VTSSTFGAGRPVVRVDHGGIRTGVRGVSCSFPSKEGEAAIRALETLQSRVNSSELVCAGANTPRRWFESAVKTAGLQRFTWHCLRHTFASRLVMAGVDICTVQELLGHKTIAMTVLRHSHLAPTHTLAAVERLDAHTAQPTDTTTDTRPSAQPTAHAAMLQ
jgi:Phage integrase family